MRNYILIGLDLETSDKKVASSEIIQFAIGFWNKDKNFDGYETLVKCNAEISKESSMITGITKEMLIFAPKLIDILPLISEHIQETCDPLGDIDRVLTAYNGKNFDIPLFVHELRRNGKDPAAYFRSWKITYFCDPFIISKSVLDTTLLQQNDRGQPNYKLACVYEAFFKKPLKNAHSALADVNAMLDLIVKNPCLLLAVEKDLQEEKKSFLLNLLNDIVQEVKVVKTSKRKINEMNTSMFTKMLSK